MDIKSVLLQNYLPYCKGTIINRAIPSIDGFKPSQRRVLYTMYTMGLINGGKIKSSNIVGQTMKIHPHGDMSIYETMIRLSTGNEALNAPYVESKGNFGKVYSDDLAFAAPRYTEAKLTPLCKEIFDGISENAVDMIDNFDSTTVEPTLLPVKFPTILVNPSNGIAVGMSTSIPSFSLVNTCKATIAILEGKVTDAEGLMDILGVPEYTTGGFIHADRNSLIQLGKTGIGSFTFSGTVVTYPDRIVVTEIPYNTTAEAIISAIEDNVKSGELKEVAGVSDEIDLKGFKLVIQLKQRTNAKAVLKKLCRLTPLRTQIHFNTKVIIGDRCKTWGLYDLLRKWIEFRVESINRVYTFRKEQALKEEHFLEAWEKIGDKLPEVASIIANIKDEDAALAALKESYGLDDVQANYMLDTRIRKITLANMEKKLSELADVREKLKMCEAVISSDNEKYKIIIDDLTRIINNHGKDNKTRQAELLAPEDPSDEDEKVDDSIVHVIVTKNGYIKRLVTDNEIFNYQVPENDAVIYRWGVRNNEDILVFTYSGDVYKILVNSIEAGRGALKDQVYKLLELENPDDIMFLDPAGDYTKHVNMVFASGRGVQVNYDKVSGKRRKYKGVFEAGIRGTIWPTFEDKFFMITAKRKAAFCDLTGAWSLGSRVAFKVSRVGSGDRIVGLLGLSKIPDSDSIDFDKYSKGYTVRITDELWKK